MNEDNQPIAALPARLEAAWNAGNAEEFAACFAVDADFIHVLGGHGSGAAAIGAAHARLFSTIYRGSRVEFAIEGIRRLGVDAAIVRLRQTLTYRAGGQEQVLRARPTLVAAAEAGCWRIVLFQNTIVAEAEPPALAGHPFAPPRSPAAAGASR